MLYILAHISNPSHRSHRVSCAGVLAPPEGPSLAGCSLDLEQLNLKDERRLRRDGGRGATVAIRNIGRDREL